RQITDRDRLLCRDRGPGQGACKGCDTRGCQRLTTSQLTTSQCHFRLSLSLSLFYCVTPKPCWRLFRRLSRYLSSGPVVRKACCTIILVGHLPRIASRQSCAAARRFALIDTSIRRC